MALGIFIGVRGNELTAKNYLEKGWLFLEPDNETTRMAKERWKLHI